MPVDALLVSSGSCSWLYENIQFQLVSTFMELIFRWLLMKVLAPCDGYCFLFLDKYLNEVRVGQTCLIFKQLTMLLGFFYCTLWREDSDVRLH